MPFRFFKKSKSKNAPRRDGAARPNSPPSFKACVDTFWQWFAANERRLFDALQNQSLDGDELIAQINAAAPMLAWELCPSPEDGKEGFALSGEGNSSKRLLVNFMIRRAPALQHWTLFSSKQASENVAGATVRLGNGEDFDFADFRFGIDFDQDAERLAIRVNHPGFSSAPADARTQLTYLALDNALGENLIESWVGSVEHTPERTADEKYTIDELRRQAMAALSLHDLDAELDPIERWSSYSIEASGDGDAVPRSDVFVGTSCAMEPIHALNDPDHEDEFEASGACFAYVMLPRGNFAAGDEVDQRGQIEDRVAAKLRDSAVGDWFGGAMGTHHAYVDIVLFDADAAIAPLQEALRGVDFASRATLCFFAPARREHRIDLIPA